jgi:Tol biopolymer transport system component
MRTHSLFVLAASALLTGISGAQAPRGGRLTIDQLIQIKHPSAPQWTADGSHIWFTYDSGGVNNLWSVPSNGSGRAMALTTWPQGGRGFTGSPDGSRIAFASGQDVIIHTIVTHADLRVAHADNTVGTVSWSADGANIIYTVQGTGAAGPIEHPASPPESGTSWSSSRSRAVAEEPRTPFR